MSYLARQTIKMRTTSFFKMIDLSIVLAAMAKVIETL